MKTLQDFYDSYAQWLKDDAPEGNPFFRACGLCSNLYFFGGCDDDLCYEMSQQFLEADLSDEYPFNGDWDNYVDEINRGETHLNEARRKWVFDHVSDVNHTKSSPLLLEFYKWWLNSDETDDTKGLCSNLLSWWRNLNNLEERGTDMSLWDQYYGLHVEMVSQFIFAGMSEHVPFNDSYLAYQQEGLNEACHLNKERLAWVEQRIQDGEDTCQQ